MIRLEKLRVRAGDFSLAIDDLSVATGEYLVVLGPTGSGKTVLLETVAGLRRLQEGRVWFDDRDVTGEPPERRGAGIVYQDYALFSHLNVADNISFGLRYRRSRRAAGGVRSRVDDERVEAIASLLGIDSLLARYPEGLSGGERQRVALARALAIKPEVLLLDEPLSALDGAIRRELREELRRIRRELGATVMHVTHDLDEALALGDRMVVLVDGRIRQIDDPRKVTCFPVDETVARLVGLTNVFGIAAAEEINLGRPPGNERDYRSCQSNGEARRPWRIRLDNGWEIVAEGLAPLAPDGRLFAVIRADEINLKPRGEEPAGLAYTRGLAGTGTYGSVLEGFVREVRIQSVHAAVDVELRSTSTAVSMTVSVHILRPDIERLGIVAGLPVSVCIPASAVHICG